MFSDGERAELRRFCGYPAYGSGASGFQGWRFFQSYGTLEYRLSNLAPAEEDVARRMVATAQRLEAAVPGAGETLDTAQAASWTRNRDEVGERLALLDEWRRRLCGFLGVPAGPALSDGGRRMVV